METVPWCGHMADHLWLYEFCNILDEEPNDDSDSEFEDCYDFKQCDDWALYSRSVLRFHSLLPTVVDWVQAFEFSLRI